MRKKLKDLKVAVIADPLFQLGGEEKHLLGILEAFPDADLYTSWYDREAIKEWFGDREIKASFIQYLPFHKLFHHFLLLLHPWAYMGFNLRKYDVVISISIHFAKYVLPKDKHIPHINICLSPPKFFWQHEDRNLTDADKLKEGVNKGLYRFYSFFIGSILERIWQRWDFNAAQRVDYFIANSKTVQERIKRIYKRDADVIYPPVDVSDVKFNKNKRENWFIYVGRIETYKGVDLAIKACIEAGVPLKVVGKGTCFEEMQKLIRDSHAKGLVKMLGFVSDEKKFELFSKAKAFIFPVRGEDFGIVAIEAMATGTPVIAYREGGPTEIISEKNPKTGMFFDKYDYMELAEKLKKFKSEDFDPINCRKQAEEFDKKIFVYKIQTYVEDVLSHY
jgi:glycosyltransferase involved in cell wall biosynthesis